MALPLRLLELELVLVPRLLVPSLRLFELDEVVALPRLLLLPREVEVELERLSLSLLLEEVRLVLVLVFLLRLLSLSLVLVLRLLLLSLVLTPLRLLLLLPRLLLSLVLTPLRLLVPRLLPESTLLRLLLELLRLFPLSLELTPLRLLVLVPRLLLLSLLTPLRLLLPLSPRDTSPVRPGAGVVLRLPLMRSVVVIVLSPRLLVMRLPLRRVGSFCTGTCEREAVIWPTKGSPG